MNTGPHKGESPGISVLYRKNENEKDIKGEVVLLQKAKKKKKERTKAAGQRSSVCNILRENPYQPNCRNGGR